MYFKIIISLLLISILLGSSFDDPVEDETIDVVIEVKSDDNFPPYEYNEDGRPSGFNIEILYAVTDVLDLKVDIKTGTWEVIRSELENTEIDILSGMFYSKERDKIVDFSTPLIEVSHFVFVRSDSDIRNLDEARNKAIIVQKGDITWDYLKENNITDTIIEVDNKKEAIALLASGLYDCALLSKVNAYYIIDELEVTNLVAVGEEMLIREFCFAVEEGDTELLSKLNKGLEIIKANGTYNKIYLKWFGIYDNRNYSKKLKNVLIYTLLPALILIGSMLLWSYSLKKKVNEKTKELTMANETLETRVESRTNELENTKKYLEETILNLNATQNQLIEIEKNTVFSNLVIGVSHEMNTPLGNSLTLVTYSIAELEKMENKYKTKTLAMSDLNSYITNTSQANKQIKQSLDNIVRIMNIFKSLDAKNSLNKISTFKINDLFKSSITFLSDKTKADITYKISCDPDFEIESYFDALFQIVFSLIENALVHAFKNRTGGNIDLEFIELEDKYRISISDNGIGIDEITKSKMFDYFFSSDHRIGSGVGLNRVHNIVSAVLKGNVDIESEINKGTKVIITWNK